MLVNLFSVLSLLLLPRSLLSCILPLHPTEVNQFFGGQRPGWKNFKYVFTSYDIDELYDLEADPYELTNRIDDPTLSDVKIELRKQMAREVEKAEDPIAMAVKGFFHDDVE